MTLITGTALYQLITVASLPIVTRIYSPDSIGLISIYLSFFNFWLIGLSWRYESALIVAVNAQEINDLYRLSNYIAVIMSVISVPALATLQYFDIFGLKVLPSWSPVIAGFSLCGYGLYMILRNYYLRFGEVRTISLSSVSRGVGNVSTRLLLGIFGAGINGLLFAEIVGSWLAYLTSLTKFRTRSFESTSTISFSNEGLLGVAKKYKKFPTFELPSSLINQLALSLPVLMVGVMYGAASAGMFGMARLVYAIPNTQVGASVGDVFQYKLSNIQRTGTSKEGIALFYSLTLKLGGLAFITLILAIAVAPIVVPIVFGENWREMGVLIAYISPWMSIALVVSSLSRALIVLQRQELKFYYDFFSLFIVLLAYFIARTYSFSLSEFITTLTIGLSLSYVIYYLVIRYAFLKNNDL